MLGRNNIGVDLAGLLDGLLSTGSDTAINLKSDGTLGRSAANT